MTRPVAIDRLSYDTGPMRLILTLLTLLTLAVLVLIPGLSSAFDLKENLRSLHPQYQVSPQLQVSQSDGMTLSQAIESVRRRTGGKVIGAVTRIQGGREVHHIKVLTKDGKVKTHRVNGRRR